MSTPHSVLRPDALERIDGALHELQGLQGLVDRCTNCGTPISDLESVRQEMIERLTAYKREFFTPGGHVPQERA